MARRPSRCAGRSACSDVESVAQLRHPLRRLPVLHARVVEPGRDEQRGIVGGVHVVVGRVRLHARVGVGLARVAPLLPLGDGERQRRVEHRGDDVDERHLGDDRGEEVGPQVRDRAHEQPARAPAARREPRRRRVAARDQVLGARDEVGEGVGLVLEPAVLVPLATHLAAAAHVRDREDEAAVEQREPRRRGTTGRSRSRTSRSRRAARARSRRSACRAGARARSGSAVPSARGRPRAGPTRTASAS